MAIFKDFDIVYKDVTYVVPSNHIMKLIAQVESVISVDELFSTFSGKKIPVAKLSMAYATILRYVNVKVTDDEIYSSIFTNSLNAEYISELVNSLITLMIPPKFLQGKAEEIDAEVPKKKRASSKITT